MGGFVIHGFNPETVRLFELSEISDQQQTIDLEHEAQVKVHMSSQSTATTRNDQRATLGVQPMQSWHGKV